MADEVRFYVEAQDLLARLGALADKPALDRIVSRVLTRAGARADQTLSRGRFAPFRGSSYPDKLQIRTGDLRRSIGSKVERTADGQLLRVVAATRYARLQEEGGTIKPVRRKYLTVPLPAALAPSGALSGRFVLRPAARGYTTDEGPTFIRRSKAGNLLVFVKPNSGGKPYPVYVLKSSTTIPPRFRFARTFSEKVLPKAVEDFKVALDRLVTTSPAGGSSPASPPGGGAP